MKHEHSNIQTQIRGTEALVTDLDLQLTELGDLFVHRVSTIGNQLIAQQSTKDSRAFTPVKRSQMFNLRSQRVIRAEEDKVFSLKRKRSPDERRSVRIRLSTASTPLRTPLEPARYSSSSEIKERSTPNLSFFTCRSSFTYYSECDEIGDLPVTPCLQASTSNGSGGSSSMSWLSERLSLAAASVYKMFSWSQAKYE
mmetsp:Transcript_24022/g.42665  ORF Transcript_24022/g.42665 Transcript_24022/m.42665 type:complete len:197 (+) Transcript_24022:1285-1875(+)